VTYVQNKLSQAQAARAAGVTQTQINRLIKSGKLSCEKTDDGRVLIEASELLRVYPGANIEEARKSGKPLTRKADGALGETVNVSTLRELLDELKAQRDQHKTELAQRDDTIADLRRRLDTSEEERRAMLRLLEDQRSKPRPWWRLWGR
jgi:transcriptional regulator with XRE-family HTH domain